MLNIRNVRINYGEKTACSNISLDVKTGESVSIIGKSGCGKTSLLYAIAGLLPVAEGSISIDGGTESCSIMFQQDRLLPWKKVIDNIVLGLEKKMRSEAQALLDRMGLSTYRDNYPDQLSGGERQRVALARSLIRAPKLLLLDEPLASLDEQTRELLQDDIKDYIVSKGITLLLVTHSIQEALYMGSKIVVMTNNGFVHAIENPIFHEALMRGRSEFFSLEKSLRKALKGV
ncbi:MAG: ABC transporter ATP-binding protein [Spirochaetales bacterium]|jgi:ABC-type nitrate/sulfonate/bicarbonate transport system ATPase subunit|nr:ABC transporter ATP-binding protein [Spirochaetales bacterium]